MAPAGDSRAIGKDAERVRRQHHDVARIPPTPLLTEFSMNAIGIDPGYLGQRVVVEIELPRARTIFTFSSTVPNRAVIP